MSIYKAKGCGPQQLGVPKSPKTFKGADHTNSTCWDGYVKKGTKISSRTGRRVNNCVKED